MLPSARILELERCREKKTGETERRSIEQCAGTQLHAHAALLTFPAFLLPAPSSVPSAQELAVSVDALSAVARAASPLTKSFQLNSWPLRRPFSVSFKPCGEIVTT